ncbi:hypothetical protein REPUB_Repub11eG0018900 [Reevesia pubescens]
MYNCRQAYRNLLKESSLDIEIRLIKSVVAKETKPKWKWASLTCSIGKDVGRNEAEKLREVRAITKPFVHVHKGTILQTSRIDLSHSVVVLRPPDLQKKIL